MTERRLSGYDVAVFGGGPGGVAAACGAAKAGARVLLTERYGFLGGAGANMLVYPFMSFHAAGQQLTHGVFQELIDKIVGATVCEKQEAYRFSPEAMKKACEDLALENGVELLYHTMLAGAECSENSDGGREIRHAVVANKAGIGEIEAKIYVDATGDADLAAFAGAPVEFGRSEDGLCQPMTLTFRMAGVDLSRLPSDVHKMHGVVTGKYLEAKAAGRVDCPREDILMFLTNEPGVVHFNTTRIIAKNATDPKQLTEAEIEGRRQVWQIADFLRREVPGFEDSYLIMTAAQIGVRESRRVMGEHLLTADELMAGTKFPDAVAKGNYDIDIHNPSGSGTLIKRLPHGEWYTIPYRSLVPQAVDNLLIAGRPISATHEAHSAIRVMPIAYGIGHASGVAAALSARASAKPRSLDPEAVRSELNRQNAQL